MSARRTAIAEHRGPPRRQDPGLPRATPAPTSTASTCSARTPSASTWPSRSSRSCAGRSRATSRSTRRSSTRSRTRVKEWAMAHGATHYTHWFVPMTGLHRREARLVPRPDRRRPDGRRVLRQEPAPGRAGRVVVPVGRHPGDVRGPRLHRVGRDEPDLPPGRAQRRHADDPDGVRLVHRRGARPQDPAPPLAGGARQAGAARPPLVRQRDRRAACSRTSARSRSTSSSTGGSRSSGPTSCSPAGRCSAPRRPRARSSRTSTSARSASGSSRS